MATIKHPTSKDVITKTRILTKNQFDKATVERILTDLVNNKILKRYKETNSNNKAQNPTMTKSYLCVFASAEKEYDT